MGYRRYPYLVLVVALVVLAHAGVAAAVRNHQARACTNLAALRLPDTTVTGTTVVPATGSAPAHCAVRLTVTNPPATDRITVAVWLPAGTWNGRFLGLGGSGFTGGLRADAPDRELRSGYAAATTDTGHPGDSGSFALGAGGGQRVTDFGHLGIHRMTVVAKAVVGAYYGRTDFRSYFDGCSTGGRQGLMEAQRYPADYDGIAAASPAINWTRFHPAQLWGQLQMLVSGHRVAPCTLTAATEAAIAACDPADGLTDGIIGDWAGCRFDARTLIGAVTPCGPVSAADAALINAIWDGPRDPAGARLWYGLERDASLTPLHDTEPFFIAVEWLRYFVVQNPGWDWRTITYDGYLRLFDQSVQRYRDVLATDDPNLSAFRDAGGKVVIWHGTADPVVMFRGSVDYYRRLATTMGGADRTAAFARFFVAPGVAHCGGGRGATPTAVLDAVVRWVEDGDAPTHLRGERTDDAGHPLLTRPVCPYPRVALHTGRGPGTDQRSFSCADTPTGTPAERARHPR
jgi:hypothetical protein